MFEDGPLESLSPLSQAISKILTFPSYNFLNPDTKNINFLKIYNSDLFDANQKQQLLIFYRAEQARRKQALLTQKPKK